MTNLVSPVKNSGLENQDRENLLQTARHLLVEAQVLSSRIAAVNEIATAINQTLSLTDILRVVGKQAKWLLDFKHCSVCRRDIRGIWQLTILFGPEFVLEKFQPFDSPALAMALKTGQPQITHEASSDPLLGNYPSQIVLPLLSEGEIMGTIQFATFKEKAYTMEDLRIGHLLALQLSSALRNAERFTILNRLYSELETEKHKSDRLLLNTLPVGVANELKLTNRVEPIFHENATVVFTDFENFTQIAERLTPQVLVSELDYCFSAFDEILEKHNLEKLKTIGDCYMCVGGVPEANQTHAVDSVLAALEFVEFINERKALKALDGLPYWNVRVGIHSGPLVAGVIGHKKFAYDVWGDTVNLASRLEHASQPGRINVSNETYNLIKDRFDCENRGDFIVKGKGQIQMYFVNGLKPSAD